MLSHISEHCYWNWNSLKRQIISGQFLLTMFIFRVVELCLAAAAKRDPSNLALHFYKNGENPDDSAGMAAFHARSACYSQVQHIRLSSPGIIQSHDTFLGDQYAVHSPICLFHRGNLSISASRARTPTSGKILSTVRVTIHLSKYRQYHPPCLPRLPRTGVRRFSSWWLPPQTS